MSQGACTCRPVIRRVDQLDNVSCPQHGTYAECDRLRAENERLRAGFTELLEEAKDMRSYVPGYFAKKWRHDEALDAAQRCLEPEGQR